jgi:hypothetical protein
MFCFENHLIKIIKFNFGNEVSEQTVDNHSPNTIEIQGMKKLFLVGPMT